MKKKEDAVKRNDEKVLRIPLRAGEAPDLLCLGMLAHQTVPGILPVQLVTEGERRTFVTAVGSRVTLRELARTHQPRAVVCGVLAGVLQALVSAGEYMLPASVLRMGTEEIWADPETGEACVTAYPVMGMHAPEEPLTDRLFGILREFRFEEAPEDLYVLRLLRILREAEERGMDAAGLLAAVKQCAADEPAPLFALPSLTRVRTGECVPFAGPILRLGAERGTVELAVTDNPSVSPRHAYLTRRGQDVCLVDYDSACGTFVNGERLAPREERVLSDGDDVHLGEEAFRFRNRR